LAGLLIDYIISRGKEVVYGWVRIGKDSDIFLFVDKISSIHRYYTPGKAINR